MKKILKKSLLLFLIAPLLGACSMYRSDESDKSDMVGTYKLVKYTKAHNKSEDKYDYKAEIGAEAYFTLDINGYVYYSYKDNNTPLKVTQAFGIFNRDIDKPELFDSISISDGFSNSMAWEKKVGDMDEPPMGFQNRKGRKTFSYTTPYHEFHIYNPVKIQEYSYVEYEQISEESSLNYLNSVLGTNYKFDKPFELQNCSGFYAYSAQKLVDSQREETRSNGVFEYAIVDFESYNSGKVDLYYSLVENPGLKMGTADIKFRENEGSFNTGVLTVFDKEYYCNNNGLINSYFSDNVIYNEEDLYTSQSFGKCGEPGTPIEQVLSDLGLLK